MRILILIGTLLITLSANIVQAESLLIGGEERFEGTIQNLRLRWPSCSQLAGQIGVDGDSSAFANQSSVNSFEGTYNLQMNFRGIQNDGGNCERFYTRSVDEIWVTWVEYLEANWVFPSYNDASIDPNCVPNPPTLVCGTGTKNWYERGAGNQLAVYNGNDGKLIGQCQNCWNVYGASKPPINRPTELHLDTWNLHQNQGVDFSVPRQHHVCYEHHTKLNTPGQANGVMEIYVTDLSVPGFTARRVANYTQLEHRAPQNMTNGGWTKWNEQFYAIQAFRQGGYGTMRKDMLDVTTTRKGCPGAGGGGGGGSTNNPPNAAPTNLTVTELWNGVKHLASTIWSWIGPASAEAAVPNDKLTLSWTSQEAGVDYDLRWQYFAHSDWMNLGLVPSANLQYVVPISPPITCATGQDCWVCADARAKRISDGVYGPWLSETPGHSKACNKFAVGPVADPIILPPPPTPQPQPQPVPAAPATVTMSGDKIFIACDPSRYTKASTTGRGTTRTITCLK